VTAHPQQGTSTAPHRAARHRPPTPKKIDPPPGVGRDFDECKGGRARATRGANSLRWAADLSEALTPSCTVTRMRARGVGPVAGRHPSTARMRRG